MLKSHLCDLLCEIINCRIEMVEQVAVICCAVKSVINEIQSNLCRIQREFDRINKVNWTNLPFMNKQLVFGCADCQRGWHSDIDELFKNITWWGKVAKISNIRKIGKQGWNCSKLTKKSWNYAKLSEVTSASLPWNGEF